MKKNIKDLEISNINLIKAKSKCIIDNKNEINDSIHDHKINDNYFNINDKLTTNLAKTYIGILGRIKRTLKCFDVHIQIKWPNDILLNKNKICGVLLDYLNEDVAVGIGINLGYRRKCNYGCFDCIGSVFEDEKGYVNELNYNNVNNECDNKGPYKTISGLTGIKIKVIQFIQTFLKSSERNAEYDIEDFITNNGKMVKVIDKKVLRIFDDGIVEVDFLKCGYKYGNIYRK